MKQIRILFAVVISIISVSSKAQSDYLCMSDYEQAMEKYYPQSTIELGQGHWVYRFKGYYWLTKVVGKPTAVFAVAVVPGTIPAVLTVSAVPAFFDVLQKKKGKAGAYIILKMSEIPESEFANQDLDSKLEEEVLELKDFKYKREYNLFGTFVKKVNKKYKNTNFTYEQVRKALIEIATEDRMLCSKRGKKKLTTLRGLIRLTKKRLIGRI